MREITIIKPDDWHLHFRDDDLLAQTVPATSRCFERAIVMPNLVPPVINAKQAMAYKQRILNARPKGSTFEPLMTLYLTDNTSAADIHDAVKAGVTAVKLYPAGATTNSDAAVTGLDHLAPVFETMSELQMPLLIHGEVTDAHIDIFDREKAFIDQHLEQLSNRYARLKIVFEHITTRDAVEFVVGAGENLAATITPQHLMLNRNDLLVGGIRPHNYCLPVLKRNTHQQSLRDAVRSGSPKFFLGTDSAPHLQHRKETDCGCAGCYSAWSAIELYTQVFDDLDALDRLENFASVYGPKFYNLPVNEDSLTLIEDPWQIPSSITLPSNEHIVPFYAGQTVNWQIKAY